MSKNFGFKVKLCKAQSPQTKGTVEGRNKGMNIAINQETNMSPTALFYKEKEYMLPLPPKDIIGSYLMPNRYRASSEALINYGGSKYSVDPKLIAEEVTTDLLDNKLYIYYNGKLVTFHALNDNLLNYSYCSQSICHILQLDATFCHGMTHI